MHHYSMDTKQFYGKWEIFVKETFRRKEGGKLSFPLDPRLEKTLKSVVIRVLRCIQDFPSQQTDPSHGYVGNSGRMVFQSKPREADNRYKGRKQEEGKITHLPRKIWTISFDVNVR